MTKPLKIVKIGNSAGIILTKDLLAKLRANVGDKVFAVETTRGVSLTPYNPDFDTKMKAAEEIMREDRNVLRVLAQ